MAKTAMIAWADSHEWVAYDSDPDGEAAEIASMIPGNVDHQVTLGLLIQEVTASGYVIDKIDVGNSGATDPRFTIDDVRDYLRSQVEGRQARLRRTDASALPGIASRLRMEIDLLEQARLDIFGPQG